jgi:phage shock protein A
VSDPGQEIALMLDDLADNIRKSELDLKQAIVDQKMMERKLEQLRKDEGAWQARAEGDEPRRRHAGPRGAAAQGRELERGEATDEALVQQRKLVEDLRAASTRRRPSSRRSTCAAAA